MGFFSRLIIRMSVMFQPMCFWQNGMVVRVPNVPSSSSSTTSSTGFIEDRALLEYNPLYYTSPIICSPHFFLLPSPPLPSPPLLPLLYSYARLFNLKIHVRGERASKVMAVLTDNIDILISGWYVVCTRNARNAHDA